MKEEDRKELSLRAIIGLTPEEQDKAVGAAASAEEQYKQAGHAGAAQAEAGADKFTEQVLFISRPSATVLYSCASILIPLCKPVNVIIAMFGPTSGAIIKCELSFSFLVPTFLHAAGIV